MINEFNFGFPTRIFFGSNISEKSGEIISKIGLSTLAIVTDKSFSRLPIFNKILDIISDAGISYSVFDELNGEPDISIAGKGAEFIKGSPPDGILGIGGGSSIDLAKALSVTATNEGPVDKYLGVDLVKAPPLPLLVMPTTAGSGSEVTGVAVLHDQTKKIKAGIVSNLIPPQAAILDPEVLTTLPQSVIAETGADAFSHAIESFYSLNANPLSEILAKESIRRIAWNLRALASNPQNINAAENMLLGSMLAGAAFLNSGVGNVHSLAHVLGGYHGTPHGLSVAILLPYVMNQNMNACLEKFAEIAIIMGADTEGLSLRDKAAKAVDEVRCLLADIGIPGKLSEIGVTDFYFEQMASEATKSPTYLRNPKKCSAEEFVGLFREAL